MSSFEIASCMCLSVFGHLNRLRQIDIEFMKKLHEKVQCGCVCVCVCVGVKLFVGKSATLCHNDLLLVKWQHFTAAPQWPLCLAKPLTFLC